MDGKKADLKIKEKEFLETNIILDKLYDIAPSCFEDLKDGTSIQRT